jgi:hypothetical protein
MFNFNNNYLKMGEAGSAGEVKNAGERKDTGKRKDAKRS